MTRTHWIEFLEDLKKIRTTNKLRHPIFYQGTKGKAKKIDNISLPYAFIALQNDEYIQHHDVADISPNEFKKRFFVTMNVFDINSIEFY